MAGILSRAILLRDKPINFNVTSGGGRSAGDKDVQSGLIEVEIIPSEICQDYVSGTDPRCSTLSSKLKQYFARGSPPQEGSGSDAEMEGGTSPRAEKKLTVELWNTDTSLAALGIEVKAKFFDDLLRLLGDDLTLKISLSNLDVESGEPGPVDIISTDEVGPIIGTNGSVSFKDVILEFPGTWRTFWMAGQGERAKTRFSGVMTIVLSSKVIGAVITEEIAGIVGMNKKILERAVGTDMKVISANGAEIACHKAFLSVQSEQLCKMIDTGLDLNNNLMLPHVSEVGVQAFLEYVYYNGLEKAKDDLEVAIELLQIAKHFEITDLTNAATDILLDAQIPEFPASAAFRMFFYAKKNNNMNALKDKSLMILKCKRDELIKLTEYKDLFRLRPEDSVELCNALLYT